MSYLLALDQGTTSSRAIVFDSSGAIRALAQEPFAQGYPQPGWVEHDPEALWTTQLGCARAALKEAKLAASDIAAIGITNQRETTLIWDRGTGKCIHPALVWQDRRTAAWCQRQRDAGVGKLAGERTGLVLDPYFSASKIDWLLTNVTGARDRAERGELAFGTVDSWLLWRLTGGVHATDVTNASRTLLFDIHRNSWSEELLKTFNIPASLLPEVKPSSNLFGVARPEWFGAEIKIGAIAGDQQAALFGQGCFASGQVKNTYGTGCFMLMHTGTEPVRSSHGLLTTAAAQLDNTPRYALEGSVFSAGSAVQWLRDELKIISTASEVEALAGSVPDTGGAYLVPAFTGLGSPYWDPHARGALVGITRGTNRAHLARAALEAIALQSAELLEAMQADSGLTFSELRVDGGATANQLLLQLQADLLGVPVVRPQVQETTAQGAADLAGLCVGVWPDAAALRAERSKNAHDATYEPKMSRDWAATKLAGWRRAVKRSLDWSEEK